MRTDKKNTEGVYDELRQLLAAKNKAAMTVQVEWVTCKSVDWDDKKTMTAVGLDDGLEFFDVLLGVGMIYTKPKQDTKCLIGKIENNKAQAFLITCDEVDEILFQTTDGKIKLQIKDDKWIWNDGNNEGIPKVIEVTDEINSIKDDINTLNHAIMEWVVVAQDGGAAVKAITSVWAADLLPSANKDDLQNNKVTH